MNNKILYAKPSISELEIKYVNDAVKNGWGDSCYNYIFKFKDLFKDYFGCDYVFPTSSCHGALHISLAALGVGYGDDVIVPDSTWVGSVFPITWLGANPVFVDVKYDTWCIDPKKIEKAITEKTKAIIAVHLYGNLAEMDEIIAIGKKYDIPVIEDAAEAIGSKYKDKLAGTIADIGVFSFHGTKTITTGEGGAIITNNESIANKISTLENQGRNKNCKKMFWMEEIGYKYKMSNIQAALGCAQIERINEIVNKKREQFFIYKELLSPIGEGVSLNIEKSYTFNSFWMTTMIIENYELNQRDTLIESMNKENIAIRPFFYPVSIFPMYTTKTENINSYNIYKKGINLPSYFELTKKDFEYIVKKLKKNL